MHYIRIKKIHNQNPTLLSYSGTDILLERVIIPVLE